MELTEASLGRSFAKYRRQCRILKKNMKSCLIAKLSIRGQLAENMLLHFADSTNLIISPSATSKKAAPSSDMRKYVNQQLRGKMLHMNIFSL